MKKLGKVLLVIIGIAIYLNIGWVVGTYYEDNVKYVPKKNLTTLGKVAAGGWSIAAGKSPEKLIRTVDVVAFSVFWPVLFVFIAISWITFAAYYFLWFVFAGGIVKSLGII